MSTGSIEDCPRTGCPKVYSEDHVVFIDECLMKNDELTTRDLADTVKITFPDAKMSDATIGRIRKELGWTKTSPQYCQLIRDVNQVKRLEWCKERIAEKRSLVT